MDEYKCCKCRYLNTECKLPYCRIKHWFWLLVYRFWNKINYANRYLHCKHQKKNICCNPLNKLNDYDVHICDDAQNCPSNSQLKEYDFTEGRFQIKSIQYNEILYINDLSKEDLHG